MKDVTVQVYKHNIVWSILYIDHVQILRVKADKIRDRGVQNSQHGKRCNGLQQQQKTMSRVREGGEGQELASFHQSRAAPTHDVKANPLKGKQRTHQGLRYGA